jgi:hypothetical protein
MGEGKSDRGVESCQTDCLRLHIQSEVGTCSRMKEGGKGGGEFVPVASFPNVIHTLTWRQAGVNWANSVTNLQSGACAVVGGYVLLAGFAIPHIAGLTRAAVRI